MEVLVRNFTLSRRKILISNVVWILVDFCGIIIFVSRTVLRELREFHVDNFRHRRVTVITKIRIDIIFLTSVILCLMSIGRIFTTTVKLATD